MAKREAELGDLTVERVLQLKRFFRHLAKRDLSGMADADRAALAL
ncbi:MAG: hypothetical protein ACPHP2_01615 [Limisphaerales bacterium]